MSNRTDLSNIFINFLKKKRYERLIAEGQLQDNQFYAVTDGNEKCEYGDLFGNIENQADLYNALCSARIFKKDMCNDPRGYAIVKTLRESAKYFDLSKFTVVGNPVINEDGVASGFSNSNYLKTIQLSQLKDKSWSITVKWINQGIISTPYTNTFFKSQGWTAWGSITFDNYDNRINFWARTGISTDANNERAWCAKKLNYTPDYIIATMSFDISNGTYTAKADWGEGEQVLGTYIPTTENKQLYYINQAPTNMIQIGPGSDNTYNKNATDLKQFSITVDGQPIFTGYSEHTGIDTYPLYNIEIPYYQSKDGVKIVDVAYKPLVDQLYTETGMGNYIIIDETNKTFRLPLQDIYSQLEEKTAITLRKWED